MSDPAAVPPRSASARIPIFAFVLTVGVLTLAHGLLRDMPFISEDWTQLAEMRAVPTFLGALDPAIEPLRPLQHAYFWILAHCGGDPAGTSMPYAARALAFVLQAGSCACVYLLAREATARRIGGGHLGALAALALFLSFPNVKTLAWTAAIGSAGRVCFELLALLLLVQHARQPRALRALFGLAAFAIALSFHESAMLLPAMLVLWIAFVQAETLREGLSRLRVAARDPWLRVLFAVTVLYGLYLVFRPQRYHELKSLLSLPAGIVKAATALLPEAVRVRVVDGFRDHDTDTLGLVVACVLFLALAAGALVLLRGSRIARFVLLACALDLGLAVVGAGFVQRYAYFSSALVAIGLGVWLARNPVILRGALIVALGAWWGLDSAHDIRDMRATRRACDDLVREARDRRAALGAGVPIVILDPIDMTGSERDIPLFNWGLDFLLEAHGVAGPWPLWRTRPFSTSTNVELVDAETLRQARRTGSPPIVDMPQAQVR